EDWPVIQTSAQENAGEPVLVDPLSKQAIPVDFRPTEPASETAAGPDEPQPLGLAAFRQQTTELPVPPPAESVPGSPAPAASQQQQPEKIGRAPQDYTRQFLRTQSVLLKQGQLNFDTGFAYANIESHFPAVVPPGNTLIEGQFRRRLLYVPIQLRYGLTDRVQVFANVPVGYASTQTSLPTVADSFSGQGGTGDTNIGASMQIRKSNGCPFDPDIIFTAGFTVPTGQKSFISALATPQTSLGQGFWAGFWNFLVVQTYDPVTIFYGFGGRHLLGETIQGSFIQPGQQFNYQLGAGFAVNERVTLSAMFLGTYITTPYVNHVGVPGAILEPQYMRFAVTVVRNKKIIEPFCLIGLTDESARSIIGMNFTFY
ncbi:MAG TPA: hypothetical protein VHY20_03715, partial [Pirellulales bacterium]|nr:hypothetical protein [Pirellulales bacterium]